MSFVRAPIAVDPRSFGRGFLRELAAPAAAVAAPSRLAADIRLFATTFLLGFVFVSAFLA